MAKSRLALTWSNQDKALLPSSEGGYDWVERDDPRVTEVRLFEETDRVGDVSGTPADNLLIVGDAYDALHALNSVPEYKSEYKGKVKLVYIDPPFNTEQAFGDFYDDNFDHSVWLTLFRDRVKLGYELLSDDGSMWVHLDDNEAHRARMVLDEIFGIRCFVTSIAWRSADTGNYDDDAFSTDHNTILVYAKSADWEANGLPRNEQQSSHYANPDDDPRGPWFDGNPLGSPNPRENLMYDLVSPTGDVIKHPPHGWRWRRETLESKLADGSVRFSPDGKRIIYRTYLREQNDLPPSTLWDKVAETGSNRKAKNELKALFGLPSKQVFATPKPEALMKRVLEVATLPGDVVVDFFAGSGTTAAVAHKLNRRWVVVESQGPTVERFTKARLGRVVEGTDKGGVTQLEERLPADGVRLPPKTSPRAAQDFQKVLRRLTGEVIAADADEDEETPSATDPQEARIEPVTLSVDLSTELIKHIRAELRSAASPSQLSAEEVSTLVRLLKKTGPVERDLTSNVKKQLLDRTKTKTVKTLLWSGGGGFRVLRVADSMLDVVDRRPFMRTNTSDRLDKFVAAQLGYTLAHDRHGITGFKNRDVLVTVDGLVDNEQVRVAVGRLMDDETVTIAGLTVHPESHSLLASLRPGSRIVKVPTQLYKQSKVVR